MKLYPISGHVMKCLFLIAWSKVDLTGLKHATCRKVNRSCFVLIFLMITPSLCYCINILSALYCSLMALSQSFRSIIESILLKILLYSCSDLVNNLEVVYDVGVGALCCFL